MVQLSRRSFLVTGSALAITSTVGSALAANSIDYLPSNFGYDIPTAPKTDEYNLKLKLVADQSTEFMKVSWEIALDSEFKNIINQDKVNLKQDIPQALNIVISEVPHDAEVFYRLSCKNCDAYEIYDLPFGQGITINNLVLRRTDLTH